MQDVEQRIKISINSNPTQATKSEEKKSQESNITSLGPNSLFAIPKAFDALASIKFFLQEDSLSEDKLGLLASNLFSYYVNKAKETTDLLGSIKLFIDMDVKKLERFNLLVVAVIEEHARLRVGIPSQPYIRESGTITGPFFAAYAELAKKVNKESGITEFDFAEPRMIKLLTSIAQARGYGSKGSTLATNEQAISNTANEVAFKLGLLTEDDKVTLIKTTLARAFSLEPPEQSFTPKLT